MLKEYPRETPLWSNRHGVVYLAEIDEDNGIITCYKDAIEKDDTRAILEQEDTYSWLSDGRTGDENFNFGQEQDLFI